MSGNDLSHLINILRGGKPANGGGEITSGQKLRKSQIIKIVNDTIPPAKHQEKTQNEEKDSTKVEDYTYKCANGQEFDGKLYYKKNGSIKFISASKQEPLEVLFDSQERLEKNLPTKVIKKFGSKTMQETVYTYNEKNIATKIEKRNQNGKVIYLATRDDEGKPLNIKTYDSNGTKVLHETVYENKDKNTRTYVTYGEDKKIEEKGETKYDDNGKINSVVAWDGNNNKIRDLQYENGKLVKRDIYKNGKIQETYTYSTKGSLLTKTTYDSEGKILDTKKLELTPDGNFDTSSQIGQGDCYLLAAINSIRATDNGQQMLKDLMSTSTDANGNKTYTIKLPGAQAAAKSLSKDPSIASGKMYITGEYTFTQDEVNDLIAKSGNRYSFGDADVLLLEAAFEKFRKECVKTVQENNLKSDSTLAGLVKIKDESNALESGIAYDSVFILTGKPSKVYTIAKNPNAGLDLTALKNGKATIISQDTTTKELSAAPCEIDGEELREKSDLDKMLDDIMQKQASGENNVIATAGINLYKDKNSKPGGHAFTIKQVTENTVTLVNPWYPDSDLTISREEFKNIAIQVTYTEADKNYKTSEKKVQKYNGNNNTKPNSNSQKPQFPGQKRTKPNSNPQQPSGQNKIEDPQKQLKNLIDRLKK